MERLTKVEKVLAEMAKLVWDEKTEVSMKPDSLDCRDNEVTIAGLVTGYHYAEPYYEVENGRYIFCLKMRTIDTFTTIRFQHFQKLFDWLLNSWIKFRELIAHTEFLMYYTHCRLNRIPELEEAVLKEKSQFPQVYRDKNALYVVQSEDLVLRYTITKRENIERRLALTCKNRGYESDVRKKKKALKDGLGGQNNKI